MESYKSRSYIFSVFLYDVNIAALDFLVTDVDQNPKNIFYLRT